MSSLLNSLSDINNLDNMARKNTFVHRIHPLIKLTVTITYLFAVISYGRYDISSLMPLIFYPILVFTFAEIQIEPIFKRLVVVIPFIFFIGILNPLFDNQSVTFGDFAIARGWITSISIFVKCIFTVTAALLLVATTGIDKLAAAMRVMKVPKLFVLQLLLTYRYLSVLIEESARMPRAYSLRAPGQKGIHRSAWGSFAGQLLLRTFDRAQNVYSAMRLRGFNGEYNTGVYMKIKIPDIIYLFVWILFFAAARAYNLPILLESLLIGVIK